MKTSLFEDLFAAAITTLWLSDAIRPSLWAGFVGMFPRATVVKPKAAE